MFGSRLRQASGKSSNKSRTSLTRANCLPLRTRKWSPLFVGKFGCLGHLTKRSISDMEKPLVIIARNIPKQGLEELYKHCTVKMHRSAKPPSRKQLLSYARAAHALVTVLTEKVDAELFAAGKNLKIVANYAVGYDNMDVKAAHKA